MRGCCALSRHLSAIYASVEVCSTSYDTACVGQLVTLRNFARQRRSSDRKPDRNEPEQEHFTPLHPATHEEEPPGRPQIDLSYRSPTEEVWPARRHQQKFAARVRDALQTTMVHMDSAAFQTLSQRHGFSVVEVRMAPDNLTAYILWDAFPDQADAAEREVVQMLPRLKRGMARVLKAKHMPRLEFRRDEQSAEQRAVEEMFARLEREG